MKKILLFGSQGFIGRNIADYYRKKKNVNLLTPDRKECNLLYYREVKRYIAQNKSDFIINAAYIEVNSNVKPTKKYLEDNLKISNNILKASKDERGITKIIFFGSGLEYGDSELFLNENDTLNPKNYYAKTKAIQSETSIALAKKYKLPLILLRPFNLYGPHDNKSVFFYIINSTLQQKEIYVTKGEQIRDVLYITDFVKLIDKVLNSKIQLTHGEIINVGYGRGILLQQAIAIICKLTNYKQNPITRDYRVNEYFHQVADINKAKKLFGWQPSVNFEEGVKKTIKWIKSVAV